MAYRIQNANFFKEKIDKTDEELCVKSEEMLPGKAANQETPIVRADTLNIGISVKNAVKSAAKSMEEIGFAGAASEINELLKKTKRDRFTVAVVGEFNKGKSTFLNHFLGKEVLPVGTLPTTAVMTRIRYNKSAKLAALNKNKQKLFERPLDENAWEGLVAENYGDDDFQGTAFVGIPFAWLDQANVELIDTPGAGDLNESRMKVLGEALLGCDGAIITIDANRPLSISEKLFIEERLLARKIPFLMVIVTKLDLVRKEERKTVLSYILGKLKSWNLDVPVYVPDDLSMEDDEYAGQIGLDKVKAEIEGWTASPARVELVENWLLGKTEDVLLKVQASLKEKKMLLEAKNEEEREKLIREKMKLLSEAQLAWGKLRLEMQQRCSACYKSMLSKIDGYAESITERLQYEARHTNNPGKWWQEDFPYRVKIELTNLSVNLENHVSRQVQEDARWYSAMIEKSFHSSVLFNKTTISDKEMFGDFAVGKDLIFDDLEQKRTFARIGTAVLSVTGFALFSAIGFLPIIATMGIGTGSTILSEKFFKKKIEEQRDKVDQEIVRCIPMFISESLEESEERLQAVYQDIINESERSEESWFEIQKNAIQDMKNPENEKDLKKWQAVMDRVDYEIRQLHARIS